MVLPLRGVVGCRLIARLRRALSLNTRRSRNQPTTDNARRSRALSSRLDCQENPQEIHRRAYIVNPNDGGARALRCGDGGERSEGAVGAEGASSEVADEGFAR